MPPPDPSDLIRRAALLLGAASRILVFTGAGASTESGIPDFRGPNGVWTKVDPDEFTINRYLASSETRRRSWAMWSRSPLRSALPNDSHAAVAALAGRGRLEGCVTQNIDGLHQRAGLAEELCVEVHGNVREAACMSCGSRWPSAEVFQWVESGVEDPHCPHCGGILKLTVISFGEMMPMAAMQRARLMADNADAVLAVGTTLSVWPAAEIPLSAARRGVPFVIVNMGPTDFDEAAHLKIEHPAGEIMSRLVELL